MALITACVLLRVCCTAGMLNRKAGSEKGLVAAFSKAHLKAAEGLYSEGRFGAGESFVIRHFAGAVEYSVDGFLDKNNSSLQEDLMDLLRASSKPFVREIFQLDEDEDDGVNDGGGGGLMSNVKSTLRRMSSGGKHKKPNKLAATNTVSCQFREQLDALLDSLRHTRTHYVKCVKPNATKSPRVFDAPLVMQQLRCNGIMELVRIKRQGYPTHSEFVDFYSVFQFFAVGKQWVPPAECSPAEAKSYASAIAADALPSHMYQVGHHMIFLRNGFEVMMRDAKLRVLDARATLLQAAFRRYRDQSAYQKVLRKVVLLQCWFRCAFWNRKYSQMLRGAVVLQKHVRGFLCRRSLMRKAQAASVIQRQVRRVSVRSAYLRMKTSAIAIASVMRMHKARTVYARHRSHLVTLQCAFRLCRARQLLQHKKRVYATELVRRKKERDMRELRASILISAFFRSIKRQGGRERAKGQVSAPVSSKGLVVKSLCKRYINILQQRRKTQENGS